MPIEKIISNPVVKDVLLNEINLSPDHLQMRSDGMDADHVEQIIEAIEGGHSVPPLTAYQVGEKLWLVDGHHTHAAYKAIDRTEVRCNVYTGSFDDAIDYAAGANAEHGKRRSRADRQLAVETLIVRNPSRSNREIARKAKVSEFMVRAVRKRLREDEEGAIKSHPTTTEPESDTSASAEAAPDAAPRGTDPTPSPPAADPSPTSDPAPASNWADGLLPGADEPPAASADSEGPEQDQPPAAAQSDEQVITDPQGNVIPERLRAVFNANDYAEIERAIDDLRRRLKRLVGWPLGSLSAHKEQERDEWLKQMRRELREYERPYIVCPDKLPPSVDAERWQEVGYLSRKQAEKLAEHQG